MKKLWYSWQEMCRDVNVLARDITLDKFDPCVIVGISRGGLIPGVMLSHWFKKPFKPIKSSIREFPQWEDYLPKPADKNVLIVDDICDSGETFQKMADYIKNLKSNTRCDIRFVSLWWNSECDDFKPTYYVQKVKNKNKNLWIVFPWEEFWNISV